MYCLRAHLRAIGCPYAIAEVDALLHSRLLQGHDGALEYTRPSVLAYREPQADLDLAGAFHVDDDGAPDLVIEILSRSTRKKDIGVGGKVADKMEHYRHIGVREYWVYNPERLGETRTSACSTASACRMPTTIPSRYRRGRGGRARCWIRAGYWATNSARRRTRRSR